MGVKLTPREKRIADAVRRSGDGGIFIDDLVDVVYADHPDGGPLTAKTCIYVLIHNANKKLVPKGFVIRSEHGGPGAPKPYLFRRVAACA